MSFWVLGKTPDISEFYELGAQLGKPGQFGVARECVHRATGERCAVKVIDKMRLYATSDPEPMLQELRTEIEILRRLRHPNVVSFYDAFESETKLYLVLELCRGGELFDRIAARGTFSEANAANVMRSVLCAVSYLHENRIAHCDLKPDNFMFVSKDEDANLKVIDFGMSKRRRRSRQKFSRMCGTPYYLAPEVLRGEYNESADLWSVGVVCFVMLFGFPPFFSDPRVTTVSPNKQIFRKIARGFCPQVRRGYGAWFPEGTPVSAAARDFISRLLVMDTAARLSADEALVHPWLTGEATTTPLRTVVLKQLVQFNSKCRFKMAVVASFTDALSDEQLQDLRTTFEQMDADGDGTITRQEMCVHMKQALQRSLTDAELEKIFANADFDGDGGLSYEELCMVSVARRLEAKEDRLWRAFRQLDVDGDGRISPEELKAVCSTQSEFSEFGAQVEALVKEVDTDGDGCVSFAEFLEAFDRSFIDEAEGEDWSATTPQRSLSLRQSTVRSEAGDV
ncbi:MAG: hypothetical protein MHM6MM_002902 [Cercozoa sp. M6MM]